jgi:hypothetical protein
MTGLTAGRHDLLDLVMAALVLAFFGASWGLVALCEWLMEAKA